VIKAAVALLALSLNVAPKAQVRSGQNDLPRCVDPIDPPLPDNMVRPKYPKEALKRGAGETVEIRAVVAPDGTTKHLTSLQGESEFSKSALDAVRHWRFHPISDGGRSVETTYRVQVRFNPLLREANSDLELESPRPEPPKLNSSINAPDQSYEETVHRVSESGMIPPQATYQPEPGISEASLKGGGHGIVDISLIVGSDGSPRDLRIICSSIPDSDQNAVDAVRQWKFLPATKDGKPVPVAIQVEVSFKRH
jgi:TonB family protein